MCIRDRGITWGVTLELRAILGKVGERAVAVQITATFNEPTHGEFASVSYTHLRAHETVLDLVCRLLLEKKKTHN